MGVVTKHCANDWGFSTGPRSFIIRRQMTRPNALYREWETVVERRRDATALTDARTGQSWTFGELARAVGRGGARSGARLGYPTGQGPEFILQLLRHWRDGVVTCPLEAGGKRPRFRALPARCVHLKLTSATTGAPRAVAFTAAQLRADVAHIMATMGLDPDVPNMAAISLAHSYGFSNLVLPMVVFGMPLILAGGSLPEQVRRAAALAPEVVLPAVPALWRAWHEAGAIPPNVRTAISAGAPLPVSLEREIFRRCGLKVHNFYGSSECGGIAYDASPTPRADGQYVGRPLRGVAVAVNAAGCLEVRGPNVGLTYWPERTRDLRGGVFRTRDLAEIREDGVYLQGRAADLINVAGRKVAPETIERVLLAHPAVRDCVVFGVPEPSGHRGEIIVAAVCLGETGALPAVRQWVSQHLPPGQTPRQWWLLDRLPVNERGKFSRAALAEQYRRQAKHKD